MRAKQSNTLIGNFRWTGFDAGSGMTKQAMEPLSGAISTCIQALLHFGGSTRAKKTRRECRRFIPEKVASDAMRRWKASPMRGPLIDATLVAATISTALCALLANALSEFRKPGLCTNPLTLAVYPVDIREQDEPVQQRSRYQVQSCDGDMPHVRVLAYQSKSKEPFLAIDTDSNWIDRTIYSRSLLALSLIGGTSESVYIFNFRHGKPTLVAKDRTVAGLKYSEEYLEHPIRDVAIIELQPKTYPDNNGKFSLAAPHVYRLEME